MTAAPIPVLANKNVRGWPLRPGERGPSPRVDYLEAGEAFTRSYSTDAHFAAYSVPGVPHRLRLDALGLLTSSTWTMVLLVVDVDGPGHRRDAAWWEGEQAKLATLLEAHPGGFVYATRGGYRLVYQLPQPFEVRTTDDKESWRTRYHRELLYLVRRFGIEGDPACADITRLYRLPRVVREGGEVENHPTTGDPHKLGAWEHAPGADELADDITTVRTLAAVRPSSWGPVLRRLAPPTPEGGSQGGHELRPEDQDEERVFKRASSYLASMNASIEGAGGNAALWAAALAMVRGFALGAQTGAAMLVQDFNPRCQPPWDRREIERACKNVAGRSEKPWGFLRDAEGGEAGLRNKPSERRGRSHQPTKGQRPMASENERPSGAEDHDDHQADDEQEPTSGASKGWRSELQADRHGYRKNLLNLVTILTNDPGWRGVLAHDSFSDRIAMTRCPPSHAHLAEGTWPRQWSDQDDVLAALWLQREWRIEAGPDLVAQAVIAVATRQSVHPVRQYLEALSWDGVPRLDAWLTTYLGVRDTVYSRAVGACTLRAAVARASRPGCKVDTMLILQGEQGAGKSTAIKMLCGEAWFTDDLADFGSKDAAMQLRGAWFIEVGELGAMTRGEVERIKGFMSRARERYRSVYGRHVQEQPRQCIFIGTTNADTYLKDETGNRRFWPVLCGAVGPIDLGAIERDRDQLWAEAMVTFRAGERWYLDKKKDAAALKMASSAQEAVQERDPWEHTIERYVAVLPCVTVDEILEEALTIDRARWGRSEQMRVSAVLKRLGWSRRRLRSDDGTRPWGYMPPSLVVETRSEPQEASKVGHEGWDPVSQPGEASGPNGPQGPNGSPRVPGERGEDTRGEDSPSQPHQKPSQSFKEVGTVGTVGTESQNRPHDAVPTQWSPDGTLSEVGTHEGIPPKPTPTPPPVSYTAPRGTPSPSANEAAPDELEGEYVEDFPVELPPVGGVR